jgi:hypothetical protein
MEYMPSDKSLADLVFQVLMACGRKAIVVQNPAVSPIMVMKFIG